MLPSTVININRTRIEPANIKENNILTEVRQTLRIKLEVDSTLKWSVFLGRQNL